MKKKILGLNNVIPNLFRDLTGQNIGFQVGKMLKQVQHDGLKILLIGSVLLASTPAFASLAVSPTRIELNANKAKGNFLTTAFDVKGDAEKPMRFKVISEYFTINEKSELVPIEKSDDPHNISKKIRFVPSEFSVPPGKIQKVRVNIANLNSLPDGESRAVLYIEDVNPKEVNIPLGQEGYGAVLVVKTRIGVPLYVDKGKFVKNGDIEYLKIVNGNDGLYTEMKVVSTGNSKIRYAGVVQISQGKKLIDEYELKSVAVGNNNYYIAKDKIQTEKLTPGQYTLNVIISYFDENGKKKTLKKDAILNIQGKV